MADEQSLAPSPRGQIVAPSGVDQLLAKIRPHWQAKSLIDRVRRLLPHDPSSACQRLLSAAVQDLREKILIAGLDIGRQAAVEHHMPQINRKEDILDNYSTLNVLDLAYRIGLLTRPEWKRMRRAYEIRRDLEHEDDEYEADIGDCVYIFGSCIEIVLSRDPIELLRVNEVKEVIQAPSAAVPSENLLRDFERAPEPRQQEIADFLVSTALSPDQPDLTRQNAVGVLRSVQPLMRNPIKIEIARRLNEKVKRDPFDLAQMKVAAAGGFLPYLKQTNVLAFFKGFYQRLHQVGYGWKAFPHHGDILDDLEDLGGLVVCPAKPRRHIVLWMTLCYLGEEGGYGWLGRNRSVFYSDTAAPRIERLLHAAGKSIREDIEAARDDECVKAGMRYQPIARRYERLLDLTGLGD